MGNGICVLGFFVAGEKGQIGVFMFTASLLPTRASGPVHYTIPDFSA